MRILVADDDGVVLDVVGRYLRHAGMDVVAVSDGAAAIDEIEGGTVDLAVLDVMMPHLDGIEVCRRARSGTHPDLPLILLTALGSPDDRVLGLESGADDYVTKPFSPRELVARIRAMLRRPRVLQTPTPAADHRITAPRHFGALSIDVDAREVRLDDEPVLLTRTEFDILDALSGRPGVVLSRRQLLEIVREGPWVGNDHLVDVHIGHLRRKLGDDAAQPRFITTVRGVGYRMGGGR